MPQPARENDQIPPPPVPPVQDQHPPVPSVQVPPPPVPAGRRPRGNKYRRDELMNLLTVMEAVVPIGPIEWDEVLDQHSTLFPGRDVDSLRRKYTTLHRKKIPTGDPNMPPEVRLAKRVKYAISDKAELGDGGGEFDLMSDDDGEDASDEVAGPVVPLAEPPVVHRRAPVVQPELAVGGSSLPGRPANSGLSPRGHKSKEKQDFYTLMALQMQNESKQRAHEAREQAANRLQLNSLIANIAGAYFQTTETKRKSSKRRRNRNRGNVSTSESEQSESSEESTDSAPVRKKRSKRIAD